MPGKGRSRWSGLALTAEIPVASRGAIGGNPAGRLGIPPESNFLKVHLLTVDSYVISAVAESMGLPAIVFRSVIRNRFITYFTT